MTWLPEDTRAERAGAILRVPCGVCHQPAGTGCEIWGQRRRPYAWLAPGALAHLSRIKRAIRLQEIGADVVAAQFGTIDWADA